MTFTWHFVVVLTLFGLSVGCAIGHCVGFRSGDKSAKRELLPYLVDARNHISQMREEIAELERELAADRRFFKVVDHNGQLRRVKMPR